MLSLYEATHLRVHGEDILDEALVFTTNFLNSIAKFSEQARCALKQPLHRGIQRVQIRRFISYYEEDESRNEKLLQLAKIEFNRLQLLHCQELSIIQKSVHVSKPFYPSFKHIIRYNMIYFFRYILTMLLLSVFLVTYLYVETIYNKISRDFFLQYN